MPAVALLVFHAVSKGLLFLCVGEVQHTGVVRDHHGGVREQPEQRAHLVCSENLFWELLMKTFMITLACLLASVLVLRIAKPQPALAPAE